MKTKMKENKKIKIDSCYFDILNALQDNILSKECVIIDPIGYYFDLTITNVLAKAIDCPFDKDNNPILRIFYHIEEDTFILSKRIFDNDTHITLFAPILTDNNEDKTLFYSLLK